MTLPAIDRDLYVLGDVVNENGGLTLNNLDGSISASGELRAQTVNIFSARDFSLNNEGWFHTNKDPRQYLDYQIAARGGLQRQRHDQEAVHHDDRVGPHDLPERHDGLRGVQLRVRRGRATRTTRGSSPRAGSRSPRAT